MTEERVTYRQVKINFAAFIPCDEAGNSDDLAVKVVIDAICTALFDHEADRNNAQGQINNAGHIVMTKTEVVTDRTFGMSEDMLELLRRGFNRMHTDPDPEIWGQP